MHARWTILRNLTKRKAHTRLLETTDLCLASYLVAACGVRLWACRAEDSECARFVLAPLPNPVDLARYHSGQATVRVRSFFRVLRALEHEMQQADEE
jgi:hypothetical protein